ncbi:MAG: transposase [Desulfobacteraceae bacterium]|jgi:hypothetical protein|nr:transposase [Desulfobacteraceae bacterium]
MEEERKAKAPEDSDGDSSAVGSSNHGKLLVDATCTPADITFPTDLKMLNTAREKSEQIIDILHGPLKGKQKKPRTYRKIARKAFLAAAKSKRLSKNKMRKALRKLTAPHVRPIKRGKAGAPTEFGAKISVSLIDGFSFVDRISWDAYNESADLMEQIEAYRRRFGCYPQSVHADKIYRTRDNRKFCKKHGIRLSGPPLGRPPAQAERPIFCAFFCLHGSCLRLYTQLVVF